MLMKRTLFLFLTSVMVSLFALCAACGSKEGGEVVVNRGQAEKATSSPGKNEFPPLKTFQFATVKVDANGNVRLRWLLDPLSSIHSSPQTTLRRLWALRMQIEGAHTQSEVTGLDQQPGIVNYVGR